jgi:hypothetical protein
LKFYLSPDIKSVLKPYAHVASLVHTKKAPEKETEYEFVVISDTLQANCIKIIILTTAGDLNARSRRNLSRNAVGSEGKWKTLKIQINKIQWNLKRRKILE